MRNHFSGRWRITSMSTWDKDYVDMEVPGHFTVATSRSGSFQFGMVNAEVDCRICHGQERPRLEFTWQGSCEGDELTGRGWAEIVDGELRGRLFIHLGDESDFRAVRRVRKS